MKERGKLALLAGGGELPLEFLKGARERGEGVITFALKGITDRSAEKLSEKTVWIEPFKLGKFLKELEREGVERLVFLGKIEHKIAFSLSSFDLTAVRLLLSLKDRKPETLIRAVFKEVEKRGIKVIEPTPYLKNALLKDGETIGKKPTKRELEEALEGLKVAKQIASLDIGQSVVIKEGSVVAVEAVEGTDECIKRGAELGGKGFIVCKAARREQDMRIDVPTVGPQTVRLIKALGGKGLAVEAEKTFILNKREIERICGEGGIFVIGIKLEGTTPPEDKA